MTQNIYNLIKDINGNHVVQKILLLYPKEKNSFIIEEIIQNIIEIAKLKQGSCIFQKVIDRASEQDKVIYFILLKIKYI